MSSRLAYPARTLISAIATILGHSTVHPAARRAAMARRWRRGWCGIAGIRPTYGLVSLHGLFPRAYSLDVAGPLARNVYDLGLLLDAMAGFDPQDKHSALAQRTKSYTEGIEDGVKGMTFATVKNYTYKDVDKPVA